MSKAWIENERIRDIAAGNPDELFHPDIAKLYDTDVPDDAANGDGWIDGVLVKPEEPPAPPAPEPVAPPAPKVSPVEFKLLFHSAERVAIKTARDNDLVIDDFFSIIEDPRLTHVDLGLQSTKDAIGYLQSKQLLTAERAAEILAGKVI